jgi:hypothetical protein
MSFTKKQNSISYIISGLLFIAMLNSAYFFMNMLGLGVGRWLAFNACSLAIIAQTLCYAAYQVNKREFILAIPLLPLYYYGSMGLFMAPWSAATAFAQITHVLISISALWTLYLLLKDKNFAALGKGLLIGAAVFVPIFALIQSYNQAHIQEFYKILQGL